MNFWWKFKLRWEVRGLCLYLHSLPQHGHVTKWKDIWVKVLDRFPWCKLSAFHSSDSSPRKRFPLYHSHINVLIFTYCNKGSIFSYIYIYYWFFKIWNHRLPLLLLLIDWIGYIWSWVPISQLPNIDKPPPGPIIGYKRKFTPLSQPKNPSASPKKMKITRIYSTPNPIYTIPHSSLKHSNSHRKKIS